MPMVDAMPMVEPILPIAMVDPIPMVDLIVHIFRRRSIEPFPLVPDRRAACLARRR